MTATRRLLAAVALAVAPLAAVADDNDGARLFAEQIAPVLEHPRCMNCHPRGDFPRQGDERRRHDFRVSRGPQDKGMPGFECSSCHQAANQAASGVPGALHWQLAPRSMAWEGLSTGELCRAITDRSKNGNRGLAQLAEHMTADALVQWGWAPGGNRAPVPIPQPEFATAVARWVSLGGPCP
jgi:hypothetical protein